MLDRLKFSSTKNNDKQISYLYKQLFSFQKNSEREVKKRKRLERHHQCGRNFKALKSLTYLLFVCLQMRNARVSIQAKGVTRKGLAHRNVHRDATVSRPRLGKRRYPGASHFTAAIELAGYCGRVSREHAARPLCNQARQSPGVHATEVEEGIFAYPHCRGT